MLSITIPLWLLLSAAGFPALILILLCVRLITKKRRRESLVAAGTTPEVASVAPMAFNDRIHHQVLIQQVDAVFDVLTTLIETERCKLKALVNHAMPMTEPVAETHTAPALIEKEEEVARRDVPAPQVTDLSIAQSISNLAEEGLPAGEIAQHLGVSLSEVTLALKMKAGRNSHVGRKVMAVA